MDRLVAVLAGLLFGAGVTLSGMVNPEKVQNFMDILGKWDPTLLFVMGAGLIVTFLGYRIVMALPAPLFAQRFVLPSACTIDGRLVSGAVVFGLGWGLTGFCPGPAIASLVFGYWPSVLFVISMAAAMLAMQAYARRGDAVPAPKANPADG